MTHVFSGLPVRDYEAASAWYTQLLGRTADMVPHDKEAVWRLTDDASLYVVQDRLRAGNGLLTVALDDLDAHEQRLRAAGITFAEPAGGDAPRRLVVTDPDGNTLTFFEEP